MKNNLKNKLQQKFTLTKKVIYDMTIAGIILNTEKKKDILQKP
jgi:hypothetical protein